MMWNTRFAVGAFALLGYGVGLVAAFTGETTWYNVNQHNARGACGKMHYDNEYVVAIAHGSYDHYPGATPNPNNNPICGKNIKATYQGKSVVVTVVDRCGDCENPNNIDMSPTAFSVLADKSVGRLYGVQWDYTDEPAGPADGGSNQKPGNEPDDAPEEKREVGVLGLVKTLRRRSTTHQGTDEPVLRRDLPDPSRLNRRYYHEVIQERRNQRAAEPRTDIPAIKEPRSMIPRSLRLRRRFSEALEKREWLQQDR